MKSGNPGSVRRINGLHCFFHFPASDKMMCIQLTLRTEKDHSNIPTTLPASWGKQYPLLICADVCPYQLLIHSLCRSHWGCFAVLPKFWTGRNLETSPNKHHPHTGLPSRAHPTAAHGYQSTAHLAAVCSWGAAKSGMDLSFCSWGKRKERVVPLGHCLAV